MAELRDIPPEPEKDTPRKSVVPSIVNSLQLAQKFSAYGFAAFAGMHLASVIVAPILSPHLGDQMMLFTRTIYQSTVGEPLLVYGSALVHLASGWALKARRAWKNRSKGFFKQLKPSGPLQKSGVLLTFLSVAHWAALRGGVLFYADGDSSGVDLGYIRYTMDSLATPFSLVLLTVTYTYHAIGGMNLWLRLRMTLRKRLYVVSVAAILAIIALIRIGQLPLATGWQAEQYEVAHKLIDVIKRK